MKLEIEVSREQLIRAITADEQVKVNDAATLSAAPDLIVAWCVYPAGAEWRLCKRQGHNTWIHSGCSQDVTHWIGLPMPPFAR